MALYKATIMTSLYSIDRQNAARILGVSVRTVDRYIASGQIRKVKNQGRTWLSNDDIKSLVSQNEKTVSDSVVSDFMSQTRKEKKQTNHVSSQEYRQSEVVNDYIKKDSTQDSNYKSLYEEAKEELKDKNQKLQQATYRIGQLESQVKSMIPRLKYEQEQKLLTEKASNMESLFKQEVQKRELVTKKLISELKVKENELESEKFNKAIYAILLFLIIFTLIFVVFLNYLS